MFTGIIEEIGISKAITRNSLTVEARMVMEDMRLGDSIARRVSRLRLCPKQKG